jgi:hypothetical protein
MLQGGNRESGPPTPQFPQEDFVTNLNGEEDNLAPRWRDHSLGDAVFWHYPIDRPFHPVPLFDMEAAPLELDVTTATIQPSTIEDDATPLYPGHTGVFVVMETEGDPE